MKLKEDRSLFACLMMVYKSHPDIDIVYEFTVVLRSLFASEGTMMYCSCKNTLMHIIEKRSAESSTSYTGGSDVKIATVHGIAKVRSLDKPDWITTCRVCYSEQASRHSRTLFTTISRIQLISLKLA